MLQLRKNLIPVFDLLHSDASDAEERKTPKYVSVIRFHDSFVGIAIDEISGLSELPLDEFQISSSSATCIKKPARDGLLIGPLIDEVTFARTVHDNDVLTILCPEKLHSSNRIKSFKKRLNHAATSDTQHASETERLPMLIFSAGSAQFALEARAIQATVPRCKVEQNSLTRNAILGSIQYHGHRVPVLHTQNFIGFGSSSTLQDFEVIILRLKDDARVGLAVDSIERMQSINKDKIIELPAMSANEHSLVRGTVYLKETQQHALVICADTIVSNELTQRIAKLSLAPARTKHKDASNDRELEDLIPENERYLLIKAGTSLAICARHIMRIIEQPKNVTVYSSPSAKRIDGIFNVEDRPALYINLINFLNVQCARNVPSLVLLVRHGEHLVGFGISSVEGIETSAWRRESKTCGHLGTIVKTGTGSNSQILQSLNLQHLASQICA